MPITKEELDKLLAEMSVIPVNRIRPEHRFIEDLRVDGDDFSFWFADEVKKKLSRPPSNDEWETVITVQDLYDLLLGRE